MNGPTAKILTHLVPGESDWIVADASVGLETNHLLTVPSRLDALILLGRWALDRGALAAVVDGEAVADLRAAVVDWEAERRRRLAAGR